MAIIAGAGPPPPRPTIVQQLRSIDFSTVPDYGMGAPHGPAVGARIGEEGESAGPPVTAAGPRVEPKIPMGYHLPDTRAPGVARALRSDPSRPYRPFGGMESAFYDNRVIVGLSGPAGTGKSRCWLEKLHLICEMFPGARCLIVRKTRESLSEAALFTYETMVLPQGHPLLDGARRSHRQHYLYPNGSEIVVAGLDKPQKLMSTEFDFIYIQEAIECEKDDVEILISRLRNNIVPFQQLVFDCNPDKPGHWIRQESLSGMFPLHATWHEDNPTLWEEAPPEVQIFIARALDEDPDTDLGTLGETWPVEAQDGRRGRWTVEGTAYRARLDMATGARYKRLRLGLWVSAEGAIYEEHWKTDGPQSNLVDHFDPPIHWRRAWSIDFGFTAPFVLQKWAFDPDGRGFMYEEIYYTKRLVSEHAVQALESSGWEYIPGYGPRAIHGVQQDPLPDYVICDVDAEGRATFEDSTGLHCIGAYKVGPGGIDPGLQAVQQRMLPARDGRPRLFVMRGALIERDPTLKDQHKPQCTAEEIDGYIWDTSGSKKKGERPLQKDDHGCDCMRQIVTHEDNIVGDLSAGDVPQGALAGHGAPQGMVVAVPRAKASDSDRDRGSRSHGNTSGIGGRKSSGGRLTPAQEREASGRGSKRYH